MSTLRRLVGLITTLHMLQSTVVHAWSDHASLAWPLLRVMPEVQNAEPLRVETLNEFVVAERTAIAELLAQHEDWALQNLEHYAALPTELVFDAATADADLEIAFLNAIRINPTRSYQPYRQLMSFEPKTAQETLIAVSELTFLQGTIASNDSRYVSLASGDFVSAAAVVSTASDEPDFGLDIGLYADNGTEHGKRYGFGNQPFGNPNLEYGSQAPFHMGFYHLDWLTSLAQPGLLQTYPLYRTELYRKLAVLAFSTGHDYWGWRFMGWGLHYVGDLAQPYHAVPLPDTGILESLWIVATGKTGEALQLVSNRHGVIEAFQKAIVAQALVRQDWTQSTLQEVARLSPSAAWAQNTLIDELTQDSAAGAAGLDRALVKYAPPKLVSDPVFEFSQSPEEAAILAAIAVQGEDAEAGLTASLNQQMQRFSFFAQAWIRGILNS
ncbi:hypothetical protein IMCC3088_1888 [Aequoribacter fuscus]|uniref:Uncharacterized protein n=1 Tax=Aequoribacter fuscus TaxID=2518989 RepID=F3L2W4_9GAMM|nr:hypothetical protein [Aequoribacter fuscus]EGG29315.1 hypothetical protein IMCC3088_1888 [Aequoribacter fuscus]QHJ87849.1 hypothetical protein EYZ66_05840 [Aequoribacter fuscus]